MNSRHLALALCTSGTLAASALSVAFGQQEGPDPKALVEQAGEFLQKQQSFAFDYATSVSIETPEGKGERWANYRITVAKPNRLAMVFQDSSFGQSIYCDGRQQITYIPTGKQYLVESAPETLGKFVFTAGGQAVRNEPDGGFVVAFLDLDPARTLLADVTTAKYVACEDIDGEPHHRCHFGEKRRGTEFEWDIWICAEGNPVIARIVPDFSKWLAHSPVARQRQIWKIEARLTFSSWDIDPVFDETLFAFEPPEGAERIDRELRPHPLLGKIAPAFQLQNLDGNTVDLARHVGKEIVVLDFWATWCEPCIATMPEVKAAGEQFADRGVVLYFINRHEDAGTIHAFLEEQKLSVPVALDTDGAVAAEYGVTGIPQTVIIGKDGKVQVVHVGFSGQFQKQLSTELEALLAGKDLAADELKKYEKEPAEGEGAAEN